MSNLHTSFNRSLHENNFSRLALRHYQVNAYLWQARIGGFMMEQTSLGHECRLLCIQGTGSGKSVLYQTLAAHYRSATIYVSPLLTLGADQVNKIMQKTRLLGNTIVPIHLDAVQSDDDMAYVTSLMTSVNPQCSVLVFTSPQTITNKFPHFVASVADHVSFVVVDELHPSNITINKNRDAWTLDVLVREIRAYPNSTWLILQSKVKGGIAPDAIKRILFCLLLKGITKLTFNTEIKKATFSLAHSTTHVARLAIHEEVHWHGITLKESRPGHFIYETENY